MCGEQLLISRKRDWQRHVLHDLEPYQCIEVQCCSPDATYNRLAKLRRHYQEIHPANPLLTASTWTCVFCEQEVEGNSTEKFCHLGHHMEEMAFSVVSRQYEEWDFYSDSEGRHSVPVEHHDNASKI